MKKVILTKAERRERRRPTMKVSGASVKHLQKILMKKKNAPSR